MNFSCQPIRIILSLTATAIFAQNTATVSGVVIDAGTKAPLAGVRVQLIQSAAMPVVYGVSTNDQGQFIFAGIPAGNYGVVPRRTGMALVRLAPDDPPVPTFPIKSGETKEIRLGLAQKAVISGR